MSPPSQVPVLIAGGGPVGLAAAMELSLHGVECAVIEPRPEVSWLRPRAKTVSARTMEHFRRWGLARRLRDRAPLAVAWSSNVVFCTTVTGREVTRFRDCFGLGLAGGDLVAEPGQQAPQPLVEQILREAVRDSGPARLITGWRVTGAAQHGEVVRVTAEDAGGRPATVEAGYVIGCDGARSVVREAIGARLAGSADGRLNVNVTFRAPALAGQVPHGPAVQYWVLNPEQPGIVGRLDLDATWWCIANGVTQAAAEADPSSIVRAMTGSDGPVEVLATDAWNARMQLADRYARGRMFIAGDAAHQNPPYGGHGFNTGVGDALPALRAAIHRTKDREFHSLDLVLGYSYRDSPITLKAPGSGERLPHRWMPAGDSLYDHLGPEFTLIRCGPGAARDDGGFAAAARDCGIPLATIGLDAPDWERHVGGPLVLVRPDQHVSWSGAPPADARGLLRAAAGW